MIRHLAPLQNKKNRTGLLVYWFEVYNRRKGRRLKKSVFYEMQTAVIKNNFELIKRKKMDEKNAKLLWKYISTSGKWFSVPLILSLSQKIFYSYYFLFNIFSSFFHPKKKFYKKSLPLAHQTSKKKNSFRSFWTCF